MALLTRLAPALALLLSAAQGCAYAVTATGRVEAAGDGVALRATNDKSRPLRLEGDATALRHAEGLLVELEGTLRKGAIDVEDWHVVEGPHGLSAWIGRVVPLPAGGVALAVVGDGGTWTVEGKVEDPLADRAGRLVLVEGLVSGPMRMRGLHWQPMDEGD